MYKLENNFRLLCLNFLLLAILLFKTRYLVIKRTLIMLTMKQTLNSVTIYDHLDLFLNQTKYKTLVTITETNSNLTVLNSLK